MEKININKFTKYSLELIFNESEKMSSQIINSINENVNKSFLLLAVYISLFSFSAIKILEGNYKYTILIIGIIISIIFLKNNLFPTNIVFKGSLPENMMNDYFNTFKGEELDKEYLATQIETYNSSINTNKETIKKMVDRFKNSIYLFLIFFIIFSIYFFISIECLKS